MIAQTRGDAAAEAGICISDKTRACSVRTCRHEVICYLTGDHEAVAIKIVALEEGTHTRLVAYDLFYTKGERWGGQGERESREESYSEERTSGKLHTYRNELCKSKSTLQVLLASSRCNKHSSRMCSGPL